MTDRDKEIIRLYVEEKKSTRTVGKLVNLSCRHICSILEKYSIPRRTIADSTRRISLNENYFNKIDCPDKAYFLGLLYADGYNCSNNNCIGISLQEKDKKILEKLKLCIEYKGQLSYRVRPNTPVNQWCLTIYSKTLSNDLKNLGCVSPKSLTLAFPTEEQVPLHLVRHFIRGYMDGDGCLYLTKRGDCNLSFIGTDAMLLGISNLFTTTLNTKSKTLHRDKDAVLKNKNTYVISIGGAKEVKRILDFLYQDASTFLERKYLKYQEFLTRRK